MKMMREETRTVVFDEQLKIEAYQFQGIMQKFPNHFHEHYVIGFIEKGRRHLSCMNRDYEIHPGDLMLFNPHLNHSCQQLGEERLDYRCLNIPVDIMNKTVREIYNIEAGMNPVFTSAVIPESTEVLMLRELHEKIIEKTMEFEKEETYYFLLAQLLSKYASVSENLEQKEQEGIELACGYMESHYGEEITLDLLSEVSGKNKYALLRNFTKIKGITPYQYLLTTRVNQAKKRLEQGEEPIEIAYETGFTDQSHFTNTFKKLIGVTPGQYRMIYL